MDRSRDHFIPRAIRRTTTPVVVALALGLLVSVSPVLAITWGPIRDLAPVDGWSSDAVVVGTGPTNAIAAFTEVVPMEPEEPPYTRGIWVRRTSDAGATWSAPRHLSEIGSGPRLAAAAARVTVVWNGVDGTLMHRRSNDGGTTWRAAVALSPPGIGSYDVGRDGSHVTVAWRVGATGAIMARTSLDGGTTFRATRQLFAGAEAARPGRVRIETAVGITYVAFKIDATTVQLRRTVDNGVTWSARRTIGPSAGAFDVAADGDNIVLAFDRDTRVGYRRSTDRGATWTDFSRLSTAGIRARNATIDTRGGRWIVTWTQDVNEYGRNAVYHRSSTDVGRTWSSRTKVGPSGYLWDDQAPGEATWAGRQIVVFDVHHYETAGPAPIDTRVRSGD